MSEKQIIGIIGAGLMGMGTALVFAKAGFPVVMYARRQEALPEAVNKVRSTLELMADHGVGKHEDISGIVANIRTTTNLKEAVVDSEYVLESIAEKLDLKQTVFKEMDEYAPERTILATNTSVMSITEVASKSTKRNRIVGSHFWNPPYILPLVEVVPGNDTNPEAVDRSYDILKKAGKYPLKVKKDVPGFVANRLQHALWREAVSIVDNGIADPETVDDAIQQSFGIRLPVLGPIENADMVGLDLTFQIHDYILKHIESSPSPAPVLTRKVEAGELGFKTGKGFRTWTPEQIDASRKKLLTYLLNWMKTQNS